MSSLTDMLDQRSEFKNKRKEDKMKTCYVLLIDTYNNGHEVKLFKNRSQALIYVTQNFELTDGEFDELNHLEKITLHEGSGRPTTITILKREIK